MSYVLKLGDIIELISPANEAYHQKTFFIDYIDDDIIEILDVTNGFKQSLTIAQNGYLNDESIKQVRLLSRAPDEGYARQNGLKVGTWITMTFAGEIPTMISGEISNVEEDMIEVITFPETEMIYIDFAYRGLPKYIPLEGITIREKPARIQGSLRKMVEDREEGEILEFPSTEGETATMETTPTGEMTIKIPDKPRMDVDINDVLKELVFSTKDIIFGDEEELEISKEVSKSEQRYGIDMQLNDLLDELLSTVPNNKRTETVMRRMHTIVRRFKELREKFSTFDNFGNVTGYKKFDAGYKPLLEQLENMSINLRWLLPVVKQRVKIYDSNDTMDDDHVMQLSSLENVAEMDAKRNVHKTYDAYYENINADFTPFTTNGKVPVKTEIEVLCENMENYYSFVVNKTQSTMRRFVMHKYNTGLTRMHQHTMKSGKTVYLRGALTQPDDIDVKSWVMLPVEVAAFSRVDMPGTNIADRVNLSHNWLYYYRMLRSNTMLKSYDANESVKYEETEFMKSVVEFKKDDNKDLLENIIPRSRSIINMFRDKVPHPYSFYHMISFYEPFLIYPDNIVYGARTLEDKKKGIEEKVGGSYQEIRYHVKEMIKKYKAAYAAGGSEFGSLASMKNKGLQNIVYYLLRENEEYLKTMKKLYKLGEEKDHKGTSETLQKVLLTDGGASYTATLSLMLGVLFKPELAAIMANMLEDPEKSVLKTKSCATYTVAKKYKTVAELQKDNDKEDVFFDAEYDNTPYSLMKPYEEERKKMLPEQFLEYIKMVLVEKHDANRETVGALAETLLAKKKKIVPGNYALLELKQHGEKSFYVRKQNTWVKADVNEESFCNLSPNCFTNTDFKAPVCESATATEARLMQKDIKANLNHERIDTVLDLTLKDMEDALVARAKYNMELLQKITWIKSSNAKQHSIFAYMLGTQFVESEITESPYAELRDHILGQADIQKKYADILRFREHFCREAIKSDTVSESEYWLYCVDTNSKLLPKFLFELAYDYVVVQGDHEAALDRICRRQGKLSEDQESIVDKHSGYVIRYVNYNDDEGFNEAGFRISTREIMEDQQQAQMDANINPVFGRKTQTGHKIFENKTTQHIYNIAAAICQYTGVDMDLIEAPIMSITSEFVKNLDSPEAYKAKQEKAAKKNIKIAAYETYLDQNKIYYTGCMTFVAIQCAIPSFKPKKTFPGCMFSFAGYPLEAGEEATQGLKYIACVIENIKSTLEPWNSIGNQKRDVILQRLMELMTKRVIMHPEVEDMLRRKRAEPQEDVFIPEAHDLSKWVQFQPPIIPFQVSVSGLSPEFKQELADSMRKGHKSAHNLIGTLYQKIIAATYGTIDSINKQVAVAGKEALLRAGTIVFLENACCEDKGQGRALDFFGKVDENINRYIASIESNQLLFHDTKIICRAPYLYHTKIEGRITPAAKQGDYSEKDIYSAFIYYCKLNSELPVPDDLVVFYPEKPHIKINDLDESIEALKKTGHNHDRKSLDDLMQIVARRNTIQIQMDNDAKTALNAFTDMMDSLEKPLVAHINKAMESKENVDELKRYLLKANRNLMMIVEAFMADFDGQANLQRKLLNHMRNITAWKTYNKQYLATCVHDLTKVIPAFMCFSDKIGTFNESVMKHWDLSQKHNAEISGFLTNYYNKLNGYQKDPIICQFFRDMESKLVNWNMFMQHLPATLIDEETDKLLQTYVYVSVYYDIIVGCDNDVYARMSINKKRGINIDAMDFETREDIDVLRMEKPDFKKRICALLMVVLEMEMKNKENIDVDYQTLSDKVFKAGKQEKKTITDRFEAMSADERNTEYMLKKYKMGMWAVGEEKGIYKYDAKTYDKEMSGELAAVTQLDVADLRAHDDAMADAAADREAYDISGLDENYMDGAYYMEDMMGENDI